MNNKQLKAKYSDNKWYRYYIPMSLNDKLILIYIDDINKNYPIYDNVHKQYEWTDVNIEAQI